MSDGAQLIVPDDFAAWCKTLSPCIRQRLSIQDLRELWEDRERLTAENAELKKVLDGVPRPANLRELWHLLAELKQGRITPPLEDKGDD